MIFGVLPPYRAGVVADPVWMTIFAQHAEACGFESLYAVEHVLVPAGYRSRYPYSETGRMPLPVDCDIPDPLDLIGFLAARTTKLRFGTGLVVLPEHHPAVLAKRCATVDRLSGGRLTLGIGVGWLREELEVLRVDPATRGARAEDAIAAMRALWSDGDATHSGPFFSFTRACSNPKPAQPTIPIHVGGHSRAAAVRAGRMGDGFHPLGLRDHELRMRVETMRAAAHDAGRDPEAVELTLGDRIDQFDEDRLAAAEKAGAERIVLSTQEAHLDLAVAQLARFAANYIAA